MGDEGMTNEAVNMSEAWGTRRWETHAPAMLQSALGPDGEPCRTPLDRRWLWRLEMALALNAPVGSDLSNLQRDLKQYLNESCIHHWRECAAEEHIPAHRQCLWCNDVEWLDADPAKDPVT